MTKRALIVIANGVEDIETVAQIDVLRRAAIDVTVVSIEPTQEIVAARGTRIVADCLFEDCAAQSYDLISLPGGLPGAERLRDYPPLIERLQQQKASGGLFGAICASPVYVLQTHGLLEGHQATCFPALRDKLPDPAPLDQKVVVSGNCITSQGPATAIDYALVLVEQLLDRKTRDRLAEDLLVAG